MATTPMSDYYAPVKHMLVVMNAAHRVAPRLDSATTAAAHPGTPEQPCRRASFLWAALLARIYQCLPLIRPHCAAQMRLIALISEPATIEPILNATAAGPGAQPTAMGNRTRSDPCLGSGRPPARARVPVRSDCDLVARRHAASAQCQGDGLTRHAKP